MNIGVHYLFELVFSLSLDIHPEVGVGSRGSFYFKFFEDCSTFSTVAAFIVFNGSIVDLESCVGLRSIAK